MRKLFWISIVLTLVTVLLTHAPAHGDESEAATARRFCVEFLAGEDEKVGTLMDQAMRDALGDSGAQQVRDALSSTLGAVKEIGQAWFSDEIQGYRRYRVPVRFVSGERDMLVAFEPGGKVGGLFTVARLDPPGPSEPIGETEGALAGTWGGTLEVPQSPLGITVRLVAGEQGWSGSIDIPAQGLLGHPLERIEVSGTQVSFRLAGIPGEPTFSGKLDGNRLSGSLNQAGAVVPFTLERGQEAELSRPQTPEPPFAYSAQDVRYESGDIVIAGTLTIPAGDGPFPAVLLISGSGAQDRDETIFGHRPFFVLADHLTKAGIAVLRVDDRGVGGTGGNLPQSTTSDLAEDALAGVRFLASRPEIDAKRIGLIGHSEGGTVAPLAASRSDRVAFIVLLAGTGVPGSELMQLQMELALRSAGLEEAAIRASVKESGELHRLIREGATVAALSKQLGLLKQAQGDPTPVAPEEAAALVAPWMRFFLGYDPRPTFAEVHVPVLALNGELDLQVDADQNLEAIREALKHNPQGTVRRMPGLNHLFQTAKTGAVAEYGQIEETLAPAVLDLVRDWILARSLVRRVETLSPVYTVDREYRSMMGPSSAQELEFPESDSPQLLWVTGFRTSMVAADGVTEMPDEFMCHSNLDFDREHHAKLLGLPVYHTDRLFTLSQGQLEIRLPEGFGLPYYSDEAFQLQTQVLQLNPDGESHDVRHKVVLEYVLDADVRAANRQMKPLFMSSGWGLVSLDESPAHWGMDESSDAQHGPGCLPGDAASGDLRDDALGQKFSGHWVVPPGRQINRTLVTDLLALRYDTTVHYMAVHLHPFAESIELRDLTEDKTVFKSSVEGLEDRIGIRRVEHFESTEGIPMFVGHQYEIVSVYENTTERDQDSMAVLLLYMLDKEFKNVAPAKL